MQTLKTKLSSVRLRAWKINTEHCLHLPLTLRWSHYVQNSACFADEMLLKSKKKPCALPALRPHLSRNKQTNVEKEEIKERRDEIQAAPWGCRYPSFTGNSLVMTLGQSESERAGPVAGRQASDSFAMLVGNSAPMPSSFQSSIKEDACS